MARKFTSFKDLAVYKLGKCPVCDLRPKQVGKELCDVCEQREKEVTCHAQTQQ